MFHPLDCNRDTDEHEYLISIQTALRPFSGTQVVPHCVIVGEMADTGVVKLSSTYGLKVYIMLSRLLCFSRQKLVCIWMILYLKWNFCHGFSLFFGVCYSKHAIYFRGFPQEARGILK